MIPVIIRSYRSNQMIAIINPTRLHNYILRYVSNEFSNLSQNCYYPRVSLIFNDLLHMCNTTEQNLRMYSKEKYGVDKESFKILHDPYTTLLILVIQEFLRINDLDAAKTTFHLFALRTYTNTLFTFTTKKDSSGKAASLCLPDVFQTALDSLSKNHMFKIKKSIATSIMYYSEYIFAKYKAGISTDDSYKIYRTIYDLKNSIKQSVKSLFVKYYYIVEKQKSNVSSDETSYDTSRETKLKDFVGIITNDMCIYRKKNNSAIQMATQITKFNRKLAIQYSDALASPKMTDHVSLAIYLLLKDYPLDIIKSNKIIEVVKKLLSVKSTKKQVYFKKIVNDIQNMIVDELHIQSWFSKLSVQSTAISRSYIAYYLAIYLRSYI